MQVMVRPLPLGNCGGGGGSCGAAATTATTLHHSSSPPAATATTITATATATATTSTRSVYTAVHHKASASLNNLLTTMPPTQALTLILPPGTEVIGLVGEGLANAVFAFSLPRVGLRAEDRSVFRGKLLRLQKAPRDGRANQFPYTEVQKYWENEIRPLFRDPDSCLVRQQLVIIKRDAVAACNRFLAEAEDDGDRDDKFLGDWVREGPQVAMIVDDMRPPPRSLDMMGEFKPKWLTQSPSAPTGSIRCRTCATYLRRFLLKPDSASLTGFNRDCRLRLCDDSPTPPLTPVNDANVPRQALCAKSHSDPLPPLTNGSPTPASQTHHQSPPIFSKEALLSSIRAHPLMREMRAIQARLDTCGPLAASPEDASFQKAMTLRDCTCYVYVSQSRGGSPIVSVRLGDLDRKDGETKTEYWRRTEMTLIEGGFYTARRIRVQGREFEVPVRCVLSEGVGMGGADQCNEALVVDVRQVDKCVLAEYGQGIAVLETGSEAVLGIRDATKLGTELQKLQDVRMTRKSC